VTGIALNHLGTEVMSRTSMVAEEAGQAGAWPGQISVVICAYTEQRWDDILAAVDSVERQSRPAAETIVVVDHNPALQRRLEVELGRSGSAGRRRTPVRVMANRERRGLSGGKNTGVALATGDVVAFLDDDAVAEPDWLRYFAASYADGAVAGVGGLTLPRWDTARPAWFPVEFDWIVGCNYHGMPGTRQPVRNLLGGNASFRRDVFTVAGGFPSDVGRSRARLPLGGEETEFCIRFGERRPGARLLIDHRAVIWHRVPAARATLSYFLTRSYAEGKSKAAVSCHVGASQGLAAERRHAFVTLPAGVARGLADALRGDLAGLGRAAMITAGLAAAAAGYAAELAARRRHGTYHLA
jgi:GT2 family glycosyltransferase